jgi:hypothetical protein
VSVLWLNATTPEENLRFASEMGATVPVVPHSPESKLADRYRVRVTPFSFMLDESGVIRAKGLVNTKAGLDLYYKEMRTGSVEEEPAVAQGAS